MTISEANRICREFYNKTNPTEDDRFLYAEALDFLIKETKDPDYMVELGAMYYEQREFNLALKYYEMAAEYDNLYAISDLGYIWYYGRTGEKDYEKAFYYFSKAMDRGDLIANYKVADMYKNGYHVEKDYEKYKKMIEDLYLKVQDAEYLNEPVPEIYTRLAKIRTEEGKTEAALELYYAAREFLSRRIRNHPFFGDLNIMKWLIDDVYRLTDPDPGFIGLYDLYEILKKPERVSFSFEDRVFHVQSVLDNEALVIRFGDQWYRTIDDFFQKAQIDGELLTTLYAEVYDFKVG